MSMIRSFKKVEKCLMHLMGDQDGDCSVCTSGETCEHLVSKYMLYIKVWTGDWDTLRIIQLCNTLTPPSHHRGALWRVP